MALNPLLIKPHCYRPGTKDIHSYPWWFDMSALHFRGDHLKMVSAHPEDMEQFDSMLSPIIDSTLGQRCRSIIGYRDSIDSIILISIDKCIHNI